MTMGAQTVRMASGAPVSESNYYDSFAAELTRERSFAGDEADGDDQSVGSQESQADDDREPDGLSTDESMINNGTKKIRSHVAPMLVMFIFLFAQTFISATNVDVVLELVCRDSLLSTKHSGGISGIEKGDPRCRQGPIASKVADFMSYVTIIPPIMGVLIVPKIVALSDRVGRKPVLIWGGMMAAINDVIRLLCVLFPDTFNYRLILVATIIQSAGGSLPAVHAMNAIYVSDISYQESRGSRLALLDACLFGSFAVGPFAGSLLYSITNSRGAVYLATITLELLFVMLVMTVLWESVTPKARRSSIAAHERRYSMHIGEPELGSKARIRRWLKMMNLFAPLTELKFSHLPKKSLRHNARLLVGIGSCMGDIAVALGTIIVLSLEFRFNWTSVETGYALSVMGVIRALTLGVLYPMMTRKLHSLFPVSHDTVDKSDLVLIRFGVTIMAAGVVCFPYAPTGVICGAVLAFDSIGAVCIPTIKNAVVKHCKPDSLGQAMGAMSLLSSLAMIIFTKGFFKIFSLTISFHPQMAFEVAGGLLMLLVFLTFFFHTSIDDYEEVHGVDPATQYFDEV
uniref:ARAD1C21626p n=1 Tax=Blastobotrys adeninivorans TaxID=409370 RepID=A0A060T1M0_BLAAD